MHANLGLRTISIIVSSNTTSRLRSRKFLLHVNDTPARLRSVRGFARLRWVSFVLFSFLFFRYRVDDRTKSASEGAETADYSAVEGREMAL